MPLHSRPIPAPKTPLQATSNPTTYLARPEPPPAPLPRAGRLDERDSRAEQSRAPEPRAEAAATAGTSRRWYRSEPWLAVMLAGFVPLLAALIAPDALHFPLIGIGGLTLIVGTAMLIRQDASRPHPESRRHSD